MYPHGEMRGAALASAEVMRISTAAALAIAAVTLALPPAAAAEATLGSFDFVNVIEAPDDKTMARISLELGSRGTGRYETLMAIPIDDFIAAL